MRRFLLALGVTCALGGSAAAQFGSLGGPGSSNNLPSAMPGQIVGNEVQLQPGGAPINPAVPSRADLKKLESPTMRLYDPTKPYDVFKGTNINPKSVVAPIAGYPGYGGDPSLLDRVGEKLSAVTRFFRPSPPAAPTYTPGISRRNKERAMERNWRRD